jgi:hypothetical protein
VTTIQERRGPAAEWVSVNPVLAAGEEGYETDTGRGKTGDGATAWNDLVYDKVPRAVDGTVPDAQIPASIARDAEVTAAVNAAVAALVASAPGTLDTLDELAAALGDDPNFATTTATALASKVAIASGLVVVNHGATAGTARPAGAAVVYWIGSVVPTNAIDEDLFFDTSV